MSNKILIVHIKDKSCNSPEGLQVSTWLFSNNYLKKVLEKIFYIEELWWLFLNMF